MCVDGLYDGLRKRYRDDPNLAPAWDAEEEALRELLSSMAEKLAANYTLLADLGVGGSGVVILAEDRNLQTKRAVKFSRPSPGKEPLLAGLLASETEALQRLSHPNLIVTTQPWERQA